MPGISASKRSQVDAMLRPSARILYRPFDMKNHAKSNSAAIFEVFSRLAESVVSRVGFFHTKMGLQDAPEKLPGNPRTASCVAGASKLWPKAVHETERIEQLHPPLPF